MSRTLFRDRTEAGRLLAEAVEHSGLTDPDTIVLALPRGGVPVAIEVARRLKLEMEALIARKIGAPGNAEFAVGAVTEDGASWLDERTIEAFDFEPREIQATLNREQIEAQRRVELYRRGRPLPDLQGRVALIVDDGLATGMTALAAARLARKKGAARVILAIPVAALESTLAIRAQQEVDAVIAVREVPELGSIGAWYDEFSQLSDSETLHMLDAAHGARHLTSWRRSHQNLLRKPNPNFPDSGQEPRGELRSEPIRLAIDAQLELHGDLTITAHPVGMVVFAHGSGSSRMSPRNRAVARVLNEARIATFLMDLLTPSEETDRTLVFDVELLAGRLLNATRLLRFRPELRALPLGFFGASTGGAAALIAAADLGREVAAVVSRGGRPDLARSRLTEVRAPTLLIVGAMDPAVLERNETAVGLLPRARIVIVDGATHLFEERGALETVADESARFFEEEFTRARSKRTVRAG